VEDIVRYSRKIKKKIRGSLGVGHKIFNLSLHRSGTQSAYVFFDKLGFSSQHWPGSDFDRRCEPFLQTLDTAEVWSLYRPLLKMHSSFHDVPIPFLYNHILKEFPDSLYMMIVRRPSAWIRSVREHTKGRELLTLEKFQYWTICESRWGNLAQYTDEQLEYGYMKFISDVTNMMVAHQAKFRIFNLEAPNLAASIAEFCGVTRWIPPFEKNDLVAVDRVRDLAARTGGDARRYDELGVMKRDADA
jgi:hypothetical protein